MSPLFSPSGLIYRYVLQSPDRTTEQLKILEDWVIERKYRSIQGVADDSGLGGTTMQYQVQIDPRKLFAHGVTVSQVVQQLGANNANAGGGFYSQGGQFYYVRGLGQVRTLEDIGNIVVATHNGIPDLHPRRRHGHDRSRAPAGSVRLHAPERRGRGRDPHAHGRAGAGRAQESAGDDRRRSTPAACRPT